MKAGLPREPGFVSGLILAGGASRRFGEPKALALLHGRPLVSWVASALAPVCSEILLSIGIQGDEEAFRDAVPRARLVRDRQADRGPIEGLHRGCEEARGDIIAVAPCDAPLLHTDLYRGLVRVLGGHEAAVPRFRVFDPVRAIYRRDAVLRVLGAHPQAFPSPSALVDELDVVFLEGPALLHADPRLTSFIDVNRRDDLARAMPLAPVAPRPEIPWPQAPGTRLPG